MKFLAFSTASNDTGLAVETPAGFKGLLHSHDNYPGDLKHLIEQGPAALAAAAQTLAQGDAIDEATIRYLPPIANAEKIVCVGLNYRDHAAETGFEAPTFPTLFARYNSTLIGHNDHIIKPTLSEQLDFEGELVAVIGTGGKDISEADALKHIAGYAIFNDASVRDYQFKSPQWTAGKNFDATGAFGPYFVTADALPAGCVGINLTTRLNGQVVQEGNTNDLIFSVAQIVSICSSFMTLKSGDVIVTGTPAGVGIGRKPPLFMKDGDVCTVEVEGLGVLSNAVRAQN
jgi:acylpyruvate hydrolase